MKIEVLLFSDLPPTTLDRCLKSIICQSIPISILKINVITKRVNKKTTTVINKFLNLNLDISISNKHYLNTIANCSADYILVLGDYVVLDKYFLSEILESIENNNNKPNSVYYGKTAYKKINRYNTDLLFLDRQTLLAIMNQDSNFFYEHRDISKILSMLNINTLFSHLAIYYIYKDSKNYLSTLIISNIKNGFYDYIIDKNTDRKYKPTTKIPLSYIFRGLIALIKLSLSLKCSKPDIKILEILLYKFGYHTLSIIKSIKCK